MRQVLLVLFWLWVLVALGVYGYRIYRRAVRGPKAEREQDGATPSSATGDGGLRSRLGGSPPPPLPDGPVEARLPQSLQGVVPDRPPGDGDPVAPAEPVTAPMPPAPTPRPTLAEALAGIHMPEGLLPVVTPDEPGLADGRRARFAATGTNVPVVTTSLAEELRRLGYAVDGLDTLTSDRAGLSASRGDLAVAVAATIEIDAETGAVVVELNV